MPIRFMTYTKGSKVPDLPGDSLFHSTALYRVYEKTSGYRPFLLVAYDGKHPIAKILAVVRKSVRWFPPSFIHRCEVIEPCEFLDEQVDKNKLFGEMLSHLTREIMSHTFMVEFRNLSQPLFGYKAFRSNGYFPIRWMRVYNSLHSKSPEERLSPSRKRQISKAQKEGVITKIAETEEEIVEFVHMLKNNYSSKILKHFPDLSFFKELGNQHVSQEIQKIFIVKYKEKIIGGSVCLFSSGTAYLLFSGALRKRYKYCYPGVMAVWSAIKYAYEQGYQHFEFMYVGVPFRHFGFRDFILRFGGKQSSTRRWYKFRWKWLNKFLTKFYI